MKDLVRNQSQRHYLFTAVLILIFGVQSTISTNSSTFVSCFDSEVFRCLHSGSCIPLALHCDGEPHCSDGSDETLCSSCTRHDWFLCDNGHCVDHQWVCDGEDDCLDWSDEKNCSKTEDDASSAADNLWDLFSFGSRSCAGSQYECPGSGLCLPMVWVCDGQRDCPGEGEEHDEDDAKCKEMQGKAVVCQSGLACDDLCVPEKSLCDGVEDCKAGEDESAEVCKINFKNCPETKYMCLDKSGCLDPAKECDLKPDCHDSSDENGLCASPANCSSITCPQECSMTPKGPVCSCSKGYSKGTKDDQCHDIDECQEFGTCGQYCTNTDGGFECSCHEGYDLIFDGRCVAKDLSSPTLLFATKTQIRALNLTRDGSPKYFSVANNLPHVVGVGYDPVEGRIYWTDVLAGRETLFSCNVFGGDVKQVVTSGLDMPEDLAVDEINRNIYITDSTAKHIAVCSLDGRGCAVVIRDLVKPRAIEIHRTKELLVFSDWGGPSIKTSKLNGLELDDLVEEDLGWPNGLAIDEIQDRLYWSDAKKDTVESIKFDKSDRRTIIQGTVSHPFSLALFEDTLYWSDWEDRELVAANKFTGGNRTILVKEVGVKPMGIEIYHPLLTNVSAHVDSTCYLHQCSHVCLPSSLPTGFSCHCPPKFELSADQVNCRQSPSFTTLLVGTGNIIYEFLPTMLGKTLKSPVLTIESSSVFGLSPAYSKLLFALTGSSSEGHMGIIEANIASKEVKDSISGPDLNMHISAITYNPLSRTLFWVDNNKRSLMGLALKTGTEFEILSNVTFLHSLLFVHQKNRLLLGETGKLTIIKSGETSENIIIEKSNLQFNPISLAYDPQGDVVFIADPINKAIFKWYWNSAVLPYYRQNLGEVYSLVVNEGYIYWIERGNSMLLWAKADGSSLDVSWKDLEMSNPRDMVVLSTYLKDFSTDSFNTDCLNSNCSHICYPKDGPSGYTCGCPFGMSMTDVGCRAHCPEHVFTCGDGSCIPNRWKCDGFPDCKNHADETSCSTEIYDHTYGCNSTTHKTCDDGNCVANSWWCDGQVDCDDGSDEKPDCPTKTCHPGKFSCSDGHQCILDMWRCDGDEDCNDGSDEKGCEPITCSDNEFRCANGMACIPQSWMCDRSMDCHDLSDEINCNYTASHSCSSDEFHCKNGNCVGKPLLCNGFDECGDGSDETDEVCEQSGSVGSVKHYATTSCEEGFSCGGKCLPWSARCNGTWECFDESDEANCPLCFGNSFRCGDTDQCIPPHWRCDGSADCGDGSDEAGCSEQEPGHEGHRHEEHVCDASHDHQHFECLDGGCLVLQQACDGHLDCLDGSDEDPEACRDACLGNGGCEHVCIPTPTGPRCDCAPGFKALFKNEELLSCEDIDECSDYTTCGQMCTNTKGSFKCSCAPGYLLVEDGRQCRAAGSYEPMILYAVDNRIDEVVLKPDGWHQTNEVVRAPEGDIRSFTWNNGEIFWTSPSDGLIRRKSVEHAIMDHEHGNGTNFEDWLSVDFPEKVAIDWITGNLYYTKQRDTTITVCSKERECVVLVKNLPKDTITHIVLDPTSGLMFVAAYSEPRGSYPNGAIYPFSMDGLAVAEADVMTGGDKLGIPSGLTLDTVTKSVFWTDLTSRDVSMCFYNGKDCRVIFISSHLHPSHVTFFAGVLFWTTGSLGTVHSYNIVKNTTDSAYILLPPSSHSIVFQHPSLQPVDLPNPCQSTSCSKLCVLGEGGKARCLAAEHRPVNHQALGSGKAMKDNNVSVEMVETTRLSGGEVGVIVAVVLVLMLLAVAVVVVVLVRRRRGKQLQEVELRFRSMDDETVSVTSDGNSKSASNGYNNPNFKARSGTGTDSFQWQENFNSRSWPNSPVISERDTDSAVCSRASSMASLDNELDYNDKKRLL